MQNPVKHVAFKVTDIESERQFYETVFGYRHVNTVRRKGKAGDHVSCHLTDGYLDITLIQYESDAADEADFSGPAPCIHHIGMEVDDLEAFIDKIRASGGTILTEPGHLPVKFRSPGGPVAEVVPRERWTGETLQGGVHGEVLE